MGEEQREFRAVKLHPELQMINPRVLEVSLKKIENVRHTTNCSKNSQFKSN